MLVDHSALWLAQTNTWILARGPGEPAVIVDAPPDAEGVKRLLDRHRLVAAGLIITHGHIDHAHGAGALQDLQPVPAWIHPDDDFLTYGVDQQLRLLFGVRVPGDYRPPVDPAPLHDGQILEIAGFRLRIRHTPGHTPGHVCIEVVDEGILFSGDQLFAGSVGRTDLPGGSYEDLMRSMRLHVLDLDDDVRVLPGHGPETTIGRERRTNPFLGRLDG